MTDEPRTFKLTTPLTRGDDVRAWRATVADTFAEWNIAYPLAGSDAYDAAARAATASLLHALGISTALMVDGVTPALRSKVRNRDLTDNEQALFRLRVDYRRALRERYLGGGTASPLAKIREHSWGWHGKAHDGVDLICPPHAVGHAICRSRVVRAGPGWWGKGAPADPALRAKGDGILILEALTDIGPIHRGMYIGYGHAEPPYAKVGEIVAAGEPVCRAGLANEWHFHFMVNAGGPPFQRADGTPLGVGDRDPWPIVAFAIKNA